jgi:8-oxo-dGTP pyrophosphatase MutT (NUDIX family)
MAQQMIGVWNKSLNKKAFESLTFKKTSKNTKMYDIYLDRHNYNTEFKSLLKNESVQPRQKVYGAILRHRVNNTFKYVLVQGRYTGKWSFPKGHAKTGESPMDCTEREVKEEIGLKNLPVPSDYTKVGFSNYYIFDLKEEIILSPQDSNEIMDTRWVTLDEMEELNLNVDASHFVKQMKEAFINIKMPIKK